MQVVHGMLWIWPQNGGDAFLKASAKKVPVDDSFAGPILPGFSSDYFYLKSGADWSMMIDNGMDPSHAPALHESQVGNRKSMVSISQSSTSLFWVLLPVLRRLCNTGAAFTLAWHCTTWIYVSYGYGDGCYATQTVLLWMSLC